MENPPETIRVTALRKAESGMMLGLWQVPVDGFEWREDLRHAIEGGGLLREDPAPAWWLVPRGNVLRRYAVLAEERLTSDFHRVSLDLTRPAILEFANRYGTLDHGQWLVRRGVFDGPGPHAVGAGGDPRAFGVSYTTWIDEAFAFRHLYEIWQLAALLRGGHGSGYARDQARRDLERRITWSPNDAIRFHSDLRAGDRRSRRTAWITAPDFDEHTSVISNLGHRDLTGAARYFVMRQINKRLHGRVNPQLMPFRDEVLRFVPDSLLTAIFLRFAFEVTEGIGQLGECRGCTRPFVPRRSNQLYCTVNCKERAGYRRRSGGARSERGLSS